MAAQDIADIIATTDGDTTWGDDMRGAITTLRDWARVADGYVDTRLGAGDRSYMVTLGPWSTISSNPAAAAGTLTLGLINLRSGTPGEVSISITAAGSAGDDVFMVVYGSDANGLPTGTPVCEWGPFDGDATSNHLSLSGQTEVIPSGPQWFGVFAPNTNAGTVTLSGMRPAMHIYNQYAALGNARGSLVTGNTASATPPDISSFTFNEAGATSFGATSGCPIMLGRGAA